MSQDKDNTASSHDNPSESSNATTLSLELTTFRLGHHKTFHSLLRKKRRGGGKKAGRGGEGERKTDKSSLHFQHLFWLASKFFALFGRFLVGASGYLLCRLASQYNPVLETAMSAKQVTDVPCKSQLKTSL